MRICMLLHKSVVHDSRVRREASALAEAGHEVTVVELDRRAAGKLDGFSRLSSAPPGWVRRVLPFQFYRGVFLAAFVGRVLRLRPDVVHAHDAAMLLPGLIGARLTGAKLVYDSHELATGVPYREGGWARFVAAIERVAVPRAAAVITVSDGIAERLARLYGLHDQPAVVRNVTDLTPAPAPTGALRRRLGLDDAPLVLHQGAPAPDRGAEQLIRAMVNVPDGHLVFLGSSPFDGFEEELRGLAVGERVAERVHFLPSVPLDQLLAWTADADVGVSLLQDTCENHRLALPNKLFEYLAAGVPVVVSDLPEIAALVRDRGVGRVAAAEAPEQIAAAIRATLDEEADPAFRARVAAAGDELSWPRERHRLIDLYDKLESHAPRRALVFVRNTVTHDARVLREAETLRNAGWDPVVVGVVSTEVRERRACAGVAPLIRLDPRSPLRRARDRVAPRTSGPRDQTHGALTSSPTAQTRSRIRGALRAAHRTLTAADFYRQGFGAVRSLRPGLVHCNDWNTMWIGVAAKVAFRTSVIFDSHELWADRNGRPEPRPWLLAAETLFVRVADEVVTTSPGYSEELARRHRIARPTLVRNLPAAAPNSGGPAGDPPVLAYVGGLLRGRGLEQAIAALAHVPDLRLALIGPVADAYRAELLIAGDQAGVADRLTLHGPVPSDQVVSRLTGAAMGLCLIQPICRSYELTLPNKLHEYAAAGLPVLASDLPVIGPTVREWDAGEVVPPADTTAIAAGMHRLLDPDRAERARAGARAMAEASRWEDERELLAGVYRRAARTP